MARDERGAARTVEGESARLTDWPAPEVTTSGRRRAVLALLLVFGGLYWLTAARSLQGGDSAEFLVVALRGGVPHPPGYPLYTFVAGIVGGLPLLDPMLRVALFSALCAVGALVALYFALLRWRLGGTAALAACGVLGVSPAFWRYAGVPEVFALGALLVALLVWVAGSEGRPRGLLRGALAGLVFGLGMSNHHTIVFALPFAGLGLYRAVREPARHGWVAVPLFGLGLAIGLTPYLTLIGPAPASGWYWGGGLDFDGLVSHFLRRDYGTTTLAIGGGDGAFFENLAAYGLNLANAFWLLVPFGVWGLVLCGAAMARPGTTARFEGAALLLAFTVAVVGFFAMANLRPVGLAGTVLERFYVLPDVLFAVACAIGLRQLMWRRPRLATYVRPFTVGLVSLLVMAHIGRADWREDYAVEDYLLNALDTVEPNSVVVGTGDLHLFGFLATSEVLAYRSDVQYVDLNLLRHRWYWERTRRRVPGFDVPFDAQRTPVDVVIASLLAHRRVYVTEIGRPMPGIERRLVPVGPLLMVVPPDRPMPTPQQVERMNVVSLQRLQFRGRAPRDPDSWSALAFSYYARTWEFLAAAHERAGDHQAAQRARSMARPFQLEEP